MEVRADKFLSGHYAYFAELPEREAGRTDSGSALELEVKERGKAGPLALVPRASLPATEYEPGKDVRSGQYQH